MAGAFPVSGTIDPSSFPFLIVDLHERGATGSLKVEGPSYQKALYFRGGRILFGSSNDPRDQLGAILIETGTITPEQLEEANSKVGPGNPLAKVLSDTGFVSQRELGEAARAKVERILADVIAYTAGSFEFEDGVLPKGAVDLKLVTEKVLLAAVRRVSDRGFVLRHLEGLDVVLTRVPGRSEPEIEAEVGELLGRIDGRATLKQAAAGTRLDEFDAAKTACALVFLGLLRRGNEPMPLAAVPVPAPATAPVGGEIDLLDTAREALTVAPAAAAPRPREPEPPPPAAEPPIPAFTFEPPATPSPFEAPASPFTAAASEGPEISLFVPEDVKPVGPPPAPEPPAPSPVFTAPEPEVPLFVDAAPAPTPSRTPTPPSSGLPLIPPPPRSPTPQPAASAGEADGGYIPSRTPDLSIPAAPAGVGPSKREAREWKPPARGGTTPAPRTSLPTDLEPEAAEPPRAASRPSKDDLAALDALLNSKTLEGPLQPLEKPTSDRWSPQFGNTPRVGARPMAAGSGRGRTLLLALVGVAAAAAGAWYYLGRPQPDASADAALSPPTTVARDLPPGGVPSTRAGPPTAPPATTAAAAVGTVPTAAPVRTPPPATPPATARPSTTPTGVAPALREARALLASGDLAQAARGFAANLRTAPAGAASVQLLIACSDATVQKAVSTVRSPELYIVPVKYQGRDCYRMLWGLYANAAQAAAATRSVPEYFRQNGASPRVMSAAELRP